MKASVQHMFVALIAVVVLKAPGLSADQTCFPTCERKMLESCLPTAVRLKYIASARNLRSNVLRELDVEWFVELKLLTTLHLGGNRIKTIPPNALESLRELQFLDLSQNDLVCLNSEQFLTLKNLLRLVLDGHDYCDISDDDASQENDEVFNQWFNPPGVNDCHDITEEDSENSESEQVSQNADPDEEIDDAMTFYAAADRHQGRSCELSNEQSAINQ
ncbi:hypothetical protein Bbelb_320980 [Branchiostoma belcheri]|nr:hypothetical protein Bbelb_320980 [Branchiostoma belcheri]